LRGLKEFNDAIRDLDEAAKIYPEEKDPARLKLKYQQDKELEERINAIMANSDSLKGKEFIDFLLDYLQGKGPQPEESADSAAGTGKSVPKARLPKYCKHELKKDEAKKLKGVLSDGGDDMLWYFNAKDGFKVLVASLHFGLEALPMLTTYLVDSEKLRDDFQRQHLYEEIIDFMHKRNVNAEGATLDSAVIHQLLMVLEGGSMVDAVRANLSEKKKIKDLFLVVINAININENRKLVASLV